jgi:hypothetical protein
LELGDGDRVRSAAAARRPSERTPKDKSLRRRASGRMLDSCPFTLRPQRWQAREQ